MNGMAFSWEPFGRTHKDESAREPGGRALPREPARGLAVLTCMDCRIDPLGALGLALGDAVVLRNAGADATDDVLRSLALAQDNLGVAEVQVVAHTDCAAHGGDDRAAASAAVQAATRIGSAVPGLRARPALLDLQTGAVSRPDAARPPSD
jgi:carbonic anhydrase